jgi:hypothetical protein
MRGHPSQAYFGDAFDEEAIRNHFTLIYELMDETMDYGYPQNCSIEVRVHTTLAAAWDHPPGRRSVLASLMVVSEWTHPTSLHTQTIWSSTLTKVLFRRALAGWGGPGW